MPKIAIIVTGLSVVAGLSFWAGSASAGGDASVESVKSSSNANQLDVPVPCRSALQLGAQGFGAALQGLGEAKVAINGAVSNGQQGPLNPTVSGVLGRASGQVESALTQYNSAKAACESAIKQANS